jgi:hypothetical protein
MKCVPDPVLVLVLVNRKFIGVEDENDDEDEKKNDEGGSQRNKATYLTSVI